MTADLEILTQHLRQARQKEKEATELRITIESTIYDLVAAQLPVKGTTHFDHGLKVVTGLSESWDQERIAQAYQGWPLSTRFPFRGVWEPDNKAIAYLRDNQPELYALLSPALTLKPKKPSFSVKE